MTEGSDHTRSIVVWDVPAAVPRRQRFAFKAGIKCMAQCRPDDWALEVYDHEGRRVASRPVGNQPWPQTAALYAAEFELEAPDQDGLFGWQVVAAASRSEAIDADSGTVHHVETTAGFRLRTVPEADCQLTVIAIDRAEGAPVGGLKVVAHPFRAMTDEHGIARLRLPSGQYRLFVSGKNFFPLRLDGELTSDQTIHAELEVDSGPGDAELWS